jgi:hypothetical protein
VVGFLDFGRGLAAIVRVVVNACVENILRDRCDADGSNLLAF